MKILVLLLGILTLTGCGSTGKPDWLNLSNPYTYGYRDYDPCIKCGEGWTFIHPSNASRSQ